MDRPGKDGTPSVREHLESAWRQTGIMPVMLAEEPDPPLVTEHIFGWFGELCAARGGTGLGPAPLSFGEIESWARLTGRRPTPIDVEWLRILDAAWFSVMVGDKEGVANGGSQGDQPETND